MEPRKEVTGTHCNRAKMGINKGYGHTQLGILTLALAGPQNAQEFTQWTHVLSDPVLPSLIQMISNLFYLSTLPLLLNIS